MGMLSRRKEPVETIVRKYGLRKPIDWGDDCEDELRKQVDLWNALKNIETDHRTKVRDLTADDATVKELQATVDSLTERIDAIIAETKKENQAERRARKVPKPELVALKSARKAVSVQLKEARRKARESCKDDLDRLKHERHDAVKTAYQQSGLWWGNYNAVVASYERARAKILSSGGELQQKWYGVDGRLTNQIQGGMSVSELFAGSHSQVSVAPLPDPTGINLKPWEKLPTKSAGRKARYTTLTATVYVRDGVRRTLTWPLYMDRDIPGDVRIKEVVVTRRRVAHKAVWHVVFTCTRPAQEKPVPTGHVVAVDVGWRRMPNGLRVATFLRDEHGKPEFVTLPESVLKIADEIIKLQKKRDDAAKLALDQLRGLSWEGAPPELLERWNFLKGSLNAGPKALARFVLAWRHGHASWMPEVLAEVDAWRARDKKQWEATEQHRQRLAGQRRMIFHAKAKEILSGASMVVFDKMNIAQAARKPTDGTRSDLPDMAKRYRVLACAHELRHWVGVQAQRAGVPVVEHDGQSRLCWHCDAPRSTDSTDLIVTCRGCGHSYDQDVNDCRRMLREVSGGAGDAGSARTQKAA